MNKLLLLSLVLALAACKPTPEQEQNLKDSLPPECTFKDLGRYGSIDNLVVITCDGRHVDATFTYMHQRSGKTSEVDRAAIFVIR